MITEGTHIRFVPAEVPAHWKTLGWKVENKHDGVSLGTIEWFSRWRKYSFFPAPETVYEEVCLREISRFIQDQTGLHRLEKRAE